jgi:hypothetical protein
MAKRVRVSGYARVRRVGNTVVVTQVKPYRRRPPKQEAPTADDPPTDLAAEHDHYLYGLPKRHEK